MFRVQNSPKTQILHPGRRWLESLARGVDNHWKEVKRVEMKKTRSVLTPKVVSARPSGRQSQALFDM